MNEAEIMQGVNERERHYNSYFSEDKFRGKEYDLATYDDFTFPNVSIIPPKNRPWYTKHRKSKW